MNNIIVFLISLFDAYMLWLLTSKFCWARARNYFSLTAFLILHMLLSRIIPDIIANPYLATSLAVLSNFGLLFCFFKKSVGIFASNAIWTLIILICEFASIAVFSFTANISISDFLFESNTASVLVSFVSRIIAIAVFYIVIKYSAIRRMQGLFHSSYTFFFITAFIIITNLIILYRLTLSDTHSEYFMSFLILSCLLFFISLLYMIDKFVRLMLSNQELDMLKQQTEIHNHFEQNIETLTERLNLMNHDYRHHLQTLNNIVKTGAIDHAAAYYEGLIRQIPIPFSEIIENFAVISCLLMQKESEAREFGINFHWDVPQSIKVNINEISMNIILSNLLDNAFDAVKKLDSERSITLFIGELSECLMIVIENTMPPEKEPYFYNHTSKSTSGHGFGIKSVKQIVKSYNGTIEIETPGELFSVTITLPL